MTTSKLIQMGHVIKSEVLQRIKADEELIFGISRHMGKSIRTVDRWVADNSKQLQIPAVLEMIKAKFKIMDNSEILDGEVANKVA